MHGFQRLAELAGHGTILLAGLLLAAELSACTEKTPPAPPAVPAALAPPLAPVVALTPPQPVAATPALLPPMTPQEQERAVMMQAVYGDNYRPATRDALVSIAVRRGDQDTSVRFFIDAVSHSQLANGDTVLVANGVEMGEGGVRMDGHVSGGFLNVFILRQADGKWRVIKRHENVAEFGNFGSVGEVQWVTLTSGKPGLAVVTEHAGGGYFMHSLALFDPAAEVMQNIGSMLVSSGGVDACAHEPEHACWSILGKWRFAPSKKQAAYDDLVFEFAGMHIKPREPRNPALEEDAWDPVTTAVKASARYAFDGKEYQLVEGENPVPGL